MVAALPSPPYRRDFDLGEFWPVTDGSAVALTLLHFEDADLLTLAVPEHLRLNRCSAHMRMANFDSPFPIRKEEYLIEGKCIALLAISHERNRELHPLGNLLLCADDVDDGERHRAGGVYGQSTAIATTEYTFLPPADAECKPILREKTEKGMVRGIFPSPHFFPPFLMKAVWKTIPLLAFGLAALPLFAAAEEASTEPVSTAVPTLYSEVRQDCSGLRATDPFEWQACKTENAAARQTVIQERREVLDEARATRRTMHEQIREAAKEAQQGIEVKKEALRQSRLTLKERVRALRAQRLSERRDARTPLFERILEKQEQQRNESAE